MITRSQTKLLIKTYEVSIDFDEASFHWNANKKKLSNGCYEYICGKQLKNGLLCRRKKGNNNFCHIHKN